MWLKVHNKELTLEEEKLRRERNFSKEEIF
jgi:hypothetical protein